MPNPSVILDMVMNSHPLTAGLSAVHKSLDVAVEKMKAASLAAGIMFAGQTAAIAGFIALEATQEHAVKGVETALRAQGEEVDVWSKKLQDAASAIQGLTLHGDESTLAVMKLGLNMGISADKIEAATKAALGLADQFDVGTNEAMKKVAMAMAGNIDALQEMFPELKKITDQSEKAARAQELLNNAFQFSIDKANEGVGALVQYKNMMGDIGESIGRALLPAISAATKALMQIIEPIGTWIAENPKLVATITGIIVGVTGLVAIIGPLTAAIGAAGTVLATLGAVIGAILSPVGILITAVTAITAAIGYASIAGDTWGEKLETLSGIATKVKDWLVGAFNKILDGAIYMVAFTMAAFNNWSDALRAAVLRIGLFFIETFENIKYMLTTVIPEYLAWFGRNWKEVFTTAATFIATVFANMWKNVEGFFDNIWKWLKGEETDWKWTALTDGFESTLKEDLPNIAERELTNAEKWLKTEIAKSMSGIWEEADQTNRDIRQKLGLDKPPEPETPPGETPTSATDVTIAAAAQQKAEAKQSKAVGGIETLSAAFDRIAKAAATKTPAEDAAIKTATNTERIAQQQEKATEAQEQTNRTLDEKLTTISKQLDRQSTAVAVLGSV